MNGLVGETLGQYQVVAQLGEGGMGTVYRAHQPSIGRDVAIKVISRRWSSQDDFGTRFLREAQLSASLSHAHIIKVFDFGHDSAHDIDYLVMEFLPNGSLADRIRNGASSFDQIIQFLTQIGAALDYAHSKGIIHRDLKPANILFDEAENAYLSDFGLAKLRNESSGGLTKTGIALGTWAYMSPEQWRSQPLDGRADGYALGVILFEMLTGQLPFPGQTAETLLYQHLFELPPNPCILRTEIPPQLHAIIQRALAKSSEERYPTAAALKADVQDELIGSSLELIGGTVFSSVQSSESRSARAIADLLPTRPPVPPPLTPPEVERLYPTARLEGHTKPITLAMFSQYGPLFISRDMSQAIYLWDTNSWQEPHRVSDYTTWEIGCAAFDPAGKMIGFGGHILSVKNERDIVNVGQALLWSLETERPLWKTPESRHLRNVLAICFSQSGRMRLVSDGSSINLWELEDDQLVRCMELPHAQSITCSAFSNDHKWIATGEGSTIRLWSIETGSIQRTLNGHLDRVQNLVFSADNRLLISTGRNPITKTGSVCVWSMLTGSQLFTWPIQARSVAVTPDGGLLAIGDEKGAIDLMDVATGQTLRTLSEQTGAIASLDFDPGGRRLASASYDRSLIIWGT